MKPTHATPTLTGAALLAALLAGCSAHGTSAGAAQSIAAGITNAAYNDDVAKVTKPFDPALLRQVTRAEVGALSDQMHAHGAYKGLTLLSVDAAKSEFTYRADFTKGSANVVLRLDPNGSVSAYRVFFPSAN